MNAKLENVIDATFAAKILMISVMGVSSAYAAATHDGVQSETVKFADLNLQSEPGVALYRRIRGAARQVCDQPSRTGPWAAVGA